MKNIKVGIAGFGRIAAVHAEGWRSVPGVALTAICDESPAAREKAAAQGLRTYCSAEEMLEEEDLDAISICTPPSSHASQAIQALSLGVAVLCEKPLTPSLSTTALVIEAAQTPGTVLQMATKFRHVPEVQFARQAIAEGEIGDPLTFHVEFAGAVEMINRWNSVPSISGGGVIIDNGSHALDLVRFVFGGVNKVQAVPIQPVQRLPVEDQAMLLVEAGKAGAGKGVFGEIMLSWSLSSTSDSYMRILGSRGDISLGWKGAYLHKDGGEPTKLSSGYDKGAAHHSMMEEFRNMLLGTGNGWITHEEILTNASSIAACYASLESSSWNAIDRAGLAAA